jgi:hypothetical protein
MIEYQYLIIQGRVPNFLQIVGAEAS